MDKKRPFISRLFRSIWHWFVGNITWNIFMAILAFVATRVQPALDIFTRGLNVDKIAAMVLLFFSVIGVLSLLKPPVTWVWNETRERRLSRAANDGQEITLRPSVARTYVEHGYIYQVILYVENHDSVEIADCYATLEQARYVYSIAETPIQVYDGSVRLNWTNSLLASEDCQITIPPRSTHMGVLVATLGDHPSPRFSVCQDSKSAVIESVGTFLIRIRVNGKRRGEELEYLVFDGSIHYEHDREPQFKAEDWTNDQRSKEIQAPE